MPRDLSFRRMINTVGLSRATRSRERLMVKFVERCRGILCIGEINKIQPYINAIGLIPYNNLRDYASISADRAQVFELFLSTVNELNETYMHRGPVDLVAVLVSLMSEEEHGSAARCQTEVIFFSTNGVKFPALTDANQNS